MSNCAANARATVTVKGPLLPWGGGGRSWQKAPREPGAVKVVVITSLASQYPLNIYMEIAGKVKWVLIAHTSKSQSLYKPNNGSSPGVRALRLEEWDKQRGYLQIDESTWPLPKENLRWLQFLSVHFGFANYGTSIVLYGNGKDLAEKEASRWHNFSNRYTMTS